MLDDVTVTLIYCVGIITTQTWSANLHLGVTAATEVVPTVRSDPLLLPVTFNPASHVRSVSVLPTEAVCSC